MFTIARIIPDGKLSAFAYDFEVNGIYYNTVSLEDLTCEVTYQKYEGGAYISPYSGDVVIPSTVTYSGKTFSVTSIGDYAFCECSGLTSVKTEVFDAVRYPDYHSPAWQDYMKGNLTDEQLVNAFFEPWEQVNERQASLLGAAFELACGGPGQTHVGTGAGGETSKLPWRGKDDDDDFPRRGRRRNG